MILPLKLQYYLHWGEIWERKHSKSHVWEASAMKRSLVSAPSHQALALDITSTHCVHWAEINFPLLSLEQSCLCPSLNMGTKTSVHRYALFHTIHSHN